MSVKWTALAWEQEYDRHCSYRRRNAALDRAGDIFEALGSAQARAAKALMDGRVVYANRLGFAQRNLLECWFWWAGLTRLHPRPVELNGVRKQLRRAIKTYRLLREQERRGIFGRLDGDAA